jgi:hypothetical protein
MAADQSEATNEGFLPFSQESKVNPTTIQDLVFPAENLSSASRFFPE